MCGIIGYIGNKNATPLLIKGLKRLEYRGYDSAGVCVVDNNQLKIIKKPGKILNLEKNPRLKELRGDIGIGHCLHPDTEILLSDGAIKKIKNLSKNCHLISYDFRNRKFVKASGKVTSHQADKLVKIKTSSADVRATPYHKFFVFSPAKEGLIEKRASEIGNGDLLILPQKIKIKGTPKKLKGITKLILYYKPTKKGWTVIQNRIREKKRKISKSIYGHLKRRDRNISNETLEKLDLKPDKKYFKPISLHRNFIKFPQKTSLSLFRLLGYYFGDGSKDKRSLKFKDEKIKIIKYYSEIIKNLFSLETKLYRESNHYVLLANSLYLVEWFKRNFPALMKKGFPEWVSQLSDEEIFAFIGGIFDAEGTVGKEAKTVLISIADEDSMRKIQMLLLRAGIVSSLSFGKLDKRHKKKPVRVQISNSEYVKKFINSIGKYITQSKLKRIKFVYNQLRNYQFAHIKIPVEKNKLYQMFRIRRIRGKGFPMVSTIEKHANYEMKNHLKKYVNSDIVYQKVIKKEDIPYKGVVYDIEVKNYHNFIANSIIQHNSRWATHGEPNEINAHPHLDCKGEIAIVHNGIIENYQALKDLLEKEGHKFSSETDTEVIAHLIEKFYQGDLEKAVIKAVKLLEGAFGLAILHKAESKIIAARRGSPLIIGVGDGEMLVASDAAAILDQTKKVVYLQDNEIAIVTRDGFSVKNLAGQKIEKEVQEIKYSLDQIEKKGFKHFMLKEIFEQPQSLENTLRGRIKKNEIRLSVNSKIDSIKRIILTACGTSWHAALIGKHIIEKLAKIPVEVDYASEFRYRDPLLTPQDLVIAISQSGETADTLGALREARTKDAATLGIINVVGSTISREVDSGIFLHAGPEIGVASTKAFSCQLVALTLLALYLQQEKGLELDKEILKELKNIPQQVNSILKEAGKIKEIAELFKDNKNFLYLGRGVNFPVALEGALKLKEISYIHAEGYPAAEMKHGPIALIDENMPVVFMATEDKTYQKILSNIEEVKARKGKIITLISKEDKKIQELSDFLIKVPPTNELLSPIINVIPLQLLAYYIADLKGYDVDRPRHLAKSVTTE